MAAPSIYEEENLSRRSNENEIFLLKEGLLLNVLIHSYLQVSFSQTSTYLITCAQHRKIKKGKHLGFCLLCGYIGITDQLERGRVLN